MGPEGYHILKLTDIKEARQLSYEQARPALIQNLRLRKARELEAAYLDDLMAKTPINVSEAALKEVLSAK
jgi:peptidylprolyl isomerase